jgi:6-phosphogluconolactonase
MCFVATDRTGRHLFGTSYEGDKLTVNRIGGNGCIEAPEIQRIGTHPKAHAVLIDRANWILHATVLGGDEILQFAFDVATGCLAPLQPPAVRGRAGSGPRHLVEHPVEPLVFVLNEVDGSVSTFARDSGSGLLAERANTCILGQDFSGTPSAADIHVTPDGKYLYATERTSSTICGFEIVGSGLLRTIEILPTEASPRSFAIDPAGRFLVVAGQLSNAVAIYQIDHETGRLTLADRLSMLGNPSWVEIIGLGAIEPAQHSRDPNK